MKLPIEFYNPDALFVSKYYPDAYRCSDADRYYIVSGINLREEIGRGKSPEKAWKDAAKRIEKDLPKNKKGTKATRP